MGTDTPIILDMLEDITDPRPELHAGPLSWRDVYSAVAASERRVLTAIGQLRTDLGKVTDDHEVRVRTIEASFVSRAEYEALSKRVSANEDGLQAFRDRESGITGTLKGQRDTILLIVAILTVAAVLFLERAP